MEKKEIAYPDSNRIGKMNLTNEVLRERPLIQALFGLCVVLEVEDHESGRGRTYIAASDLFQPLAEGEEIPEYRIEFACNQAFPNPEHERARRNNGSFGFVAIRQFIVRAPAARLAHRPVAPGHIN